MRGRGEEIIRISQYMSVLRLLHDESSLMIVKTVRQAMACRNRSIPELSVEKQDVTQMSAIAFCRGNFARSLLPAFESWSRDRSGNHPKAKKRPPLNF
ncbi:MAG: hypothetical protein MUC48_05030 [Leptolyngbya sp. Prado105]|nr:hypothetical protein [Leptolyngbya sp. Prado105]